MSVDVTHIALATCVVRNHVLQIVEDVTVAIYILVRRKCMFIK